MSPEDTKTALADEVLVSILRLLLEEGDGLILGLYGDSRLMPVATADSLEVNVFRPVKEWREMAEADTDQMDEGGRELRRMAMAGLRPTIDLYWAIIENVGVPAVARIASGRRPRIPPE